MRRLLVIGTVVIILLSGFFIARESQAVPTFARKYKTSCSTCHYAFPRLNNHGKAFRSNGLRYPGDDKEYAKEEAVSLGSEGYKKVFPNAIWPADIPGPTTVSFRWISRAHYEPENTGREFSFENPHELEAFMPGTIGEDFAFFFELEWEHAGEFAFGGWLDYMFSKTFHARLGNIEYLPIHDHERLTREHYNYNSFAELDASGLEFWGGVNGPQDRGGFLYSVGIINGENDGVENIDLNSQKDFFGKASYKIGGMGVLGSTHAHETHETSAFWKDNSVTIGAFGHAGRNADASKNRNIGGNADIFYENLNVFGLAMISRSKGAGDTEWTDVTRGFVEADYVVYPWLIPLLRYEVTKPEDQNAAEQFVPAVVVMARANIKIVPTARIDLNGRRDRTRFNLDVEAGF